METIKQKRNISGIYFRFKTEKGFENRVFEDLPDSEQDKILSEFDVVAIKRLCKILASVINTLGDEFDIVSGRENKDV
jgi:hypothetical protein